MSGRAAAIVGTILGYCGVALLIVVIAGLFLGSFVYLLVGNVDVARAGRVDADFQAIATQLRTYEMMNMKMPTTAQGLLALVERPSEEPAPRRWVKLLERVPVDPWGEQYVYSYPGSRNQNGFDLISKGPDRELGTSDDMTNR
jgi:general secretion pathway protein G